MNKRDYIYDPPPAERWTGEALKMLRTRLGWSKLRMSEFLGLSQGNAIYYLETGKSNFSGPVMRMLDLLDEYGEEVDGIWRQRAVFHEPDYE